MAMFGSSVPRSNRRCRSDPGTLLHILATLRAPSRCLSWRIRSPRSGLFLRRPTRWTPHSDPWLVMREFRGRIPETSCEPIEVRNLKPQKKPSGSRSIEAKRKPIQVQTHRADDNRSEFNAISLLFVVCRLHCSMASEFSLLFAVCRLHYSMAWNSISGTKRSFSRVTCSW